MRDINKQLAEANSHAEIDAILHEGPTHQRAPRRHEAADEPAEPVTLTRTEIIGGKSFTFEAATELELERAVGAAFKIAAELQQHPVPVAETVDPNRAALDAAAQTELELRFKRGEISTTDYLEQSGAVKNYLEAQGVPIDEVRANLEETRHRNYEQSWADATTAFLDSGSNWPGGEKNKKLLGLKLQELGLLDATDKVAAIQQAYASMKQDGLLFDGAAEETHAAPARRAAAPTGRTRQPADPVQKIDTSRLSPAEILELYKNGRDPQTVNAEFSSLFGRS